MLLTLLSQFKAEFSEYKSHDIQNAFVLICGILIKRTVCLYRLRGFVGNYLGNSSSGLDAHYKRLTRFFCAHRDTNLWRSFLSQGLGLFLGKVEYLILDGTKWSFGTRIYHLQTLSMIYKGVSIPIAWTDIEKMGVSSEAERQSLFEEAMDWCQLKGKTLLADREYIGTKWFNFLLSKGIGLVIRVRLGDYEKAINESAGLSYDELLAKASKGNGTYGKRVTIEGNTYWFCVKRNRKAKPDDPFLLLLSSYHRPKKAAEVYARRWKIEKCFKHLKSNGFNLESVRLQDENKVRLLMALVVFAYCLAIHFGLKHFAKVKLKKYPNGETHPVISVFRWGLDLLELQCNGVAQFYQFLHQQFFEINQRKISQFSIHVQ